MSQLLNHILIFCLSNLVFLFLGILALRISLKRIFLTPLNIFVCHLMGIVITVILTSLYFSSGVTINILLIPLLVMFMRYAFFDTKPIAKLNQFLLLLGFACLFVFFIFVFKYYNFQIGGAVSAHLDYLTYSNISEYLVDSGIENGSLNYFHPEQITPAPYHYFELWLNAFFYSVSSFFSLNTLFFATFPTLLFSLVLGFISFIAHYTSEARYYLLGIILLFVCGTSFSIYDDMNLFREMSNLSYGPLEYYKLLVPSALVLLSLNFIIRKQINTGLITLLFLPVVNILFIFIIPLVPIIISSVLAFANRIQKRFVFIHIIYGVFLFVSVLLFYKLNAIEESSSSGRSDSLLLNSVQYLLDPSYLSTAVNIFCKSLFQLFILYVPYLIVFTFISWFFSLSIVNILIRRKLLIFMFTGILLYALFCWAVLHWFFNSFQFFIIPASILMNTFIALGIVYFILKLRLLNKFSLKNSFALFLLIGIPVFHGIRLVGDKPISNYSMGFLNQVKAEFSTNQINPIGGFVKDYGVGDNFSNTSPSYIIEGGFLEFTTRGAFPTSLTAYEIKISEDINKSVWELNRRRLNPMCIFYDNEKQLDSLKRDSDVITSFIAQNDIDYVVFEHTEQQRNLNLDIVKIISDPLSGRSIAFLRKD